MAILDFDSHAKHIGYTMTLAAGGFAYTDAKYQDGDTLFAIVPGASLPASIIVLIALLMFVFALISGAFALFGMSGLNQLTAQKDVVKSKISSEELKRAVSGGPPTEEEKSNFELLKNITKEIEDYTKTLKKYSKRQLSFLVTGLVLSTILFADSKFDPNTSPPKCQLQIDSHGKLILPVACVPKALR